MTEYIKKEDALFAFYRLYVVPKSDDSEKYMQQIEDIHNDIKKLPAADVSELKHGKWKKTWHTFFKAELPVCSCCKRLSVSDGYNYCPNCGAIMDGDQ